MDAVFLNLRLGAFLYFAALLAVSAQSSSQNSQSATSATQVANQSAVQSFVQQQQSLFQQRQALIDQGATQEQLAAWRQQHAAQFAALQQQAQFISNTSALQARPTDVQPNIPPNASQAMKDFLTTQASLANARAQIHNQMVQAMPANATSDQVNAMLQKERQTFQQQHVSELQLQAQRIQTLTAESAQNQPTTLPSLQVPPNSSPQLTAYLTQRYQLMQSRRQARIQYANADPATRQAALQQWQQQNAGAVQQLQQQAQTIAQTTSDTQN